MFKVIAYLDEWEDLYVSEHASPSLRAYRGREGIRDGRDEEFLITELGYAKPSEGRPRLVQLYTMATQPWASLLISDFLRTHADDEIAEILKGGSRTSLGKQISSLFKICETIDSQFGHNDEKLKNVTEEKKAPRLRGIAPGLAAIPILAVIISAVLLAWTFRMRTNLRELGERLSVEQARFEKLQGTNAQLTVVNKQLVDSVSRLNDQQKGLQSAISDLDATRRQLESTNNSLNNEAKIKLERMQRGQWREIVETQIIATLKVRERGFTRDEIVRSVKVALPAIADEFIKETLKALVGGGAVVNYGSTEWSGDYRLNNDK